MRRLSASLLSSYLVIFFGISTSGCKQRDDTQALIDAIEKLDVEEAKAASVEEDTGINPRLLRRFEPLHGVLSSESHPTSPERVELGRMLYFEPRLSKNHDVSCNSCHVLDEYGVDHRRFSEGHKKQLGTRNSPTVYNAAGLFVQFWDGRAADVEEQATGPILNPVEMAVGSEAELVATLKSLPEYVDRFNAAFPEEKQPITLNNVGVAVGAFERGLVTPSRWDAYLKGDSKALSAAELEGLKAFTSLGCMVCHTGEFVGGSMHQKVGAVVPWPNQTDQGRYTITQQEADRMVFRVPTLRNVAMTAPYFHDGSAATLPEAVRMMAKHQLGLEPSEAEVASIVVWLQTLTGELPLDYIRAPKLPPDSASTPKPQSG